MEDKLYTIGEALDNIRPGLMAISVVETIEKPTTIFYDDEGWLCILYPNKEFAHYNHNFLWSGFQEKEEDRNPPKKRWIIKPIPEDYMIKIRPSHYEDIKHLIYKDGKPEIITESEEK